MPECRNHFLPTKKNSQESNYPPLDGVSVNCLSCTQIKKPPDASKSSEGGFNIYPNTNVGNLEFLELVDQLNAKQIGIKVIKASDNLTACFIRVIEIAFAGAVQHSGGNVDLQILHGLERRT